MSREGVVAEAALLGSLPRELRDELVVLADPLRVRAHEWLFLEGDQADRLFFVVTGRLRVLVEDEEGRKVLRLLGPGAAIGELAVLTGSARSASVQAVRDSELLEIDSERFRDLLQRTPQLGLSLATALAQQLQDSGGLREVDVPPSVFAVTARSGRDVEELWHGLHAAFRELGSTVALDGPPADRSDEADWGASLDRLERDHEHVLLLAAGATGRWTDFCVRQADRVVVVAEPAAPPRGAVPEGCDVVFLQHADPALFAAWHDAAHPRAHHVVAPDGDLPDACGRIVRRLTGRSLGLVLSGGGARALAHVGVLEVLEDEGIAVDRVGGTSMGAFVAAMVALGWRAEQMREACEVEIRTRSPFSDYTVPRHSLIRARRAESMLRRLFGDATLEALPLPLFTVSADLLSGRMVVHRSGPLVEAVGTSMAIPGLAPPVSRQEHLLVDGGVLNNLPIDVMAAQEPGPVIAVDVMRRIGPDDLRAAAVRDALPTILETLSRATVLGSVERAEANRGLATLVIAPEIQHLSLRDFRHVDQAIEAGRRAAEAAFAAGAREELLDAVRRPGVSVLAGR